jgi:hypothetical protein
MAHREKLYSDYGKRCTCGGTIHRYEFDVPLLRSDSNRLIDVFCYTCHAPTFFYVEHWSKMPSTPSEAAKLHRES